MRLWPLVILARIPSAADLGGVGAMLLQSAGASARTQPAPVPRAVSPILLGILAVGFWVLVVWCVRRIARPDKLRLADAPPRHNSLNPIHILVLLTLWLGAGVATNWILGWQLEEGDLRRVLLAGLAGHVALLTGGLAVAHFAFRRGLRRGAGLSLRRWLWDFLRGLFACLAVLPVCFAALQVTRFLIPFDRIETHQVLLAFDELGGGWTLVGAGMAIVLAPLAEELFFRGVIQSMLRRYLARPWAAVGLTGVFFALVHAPYWDTMPALFVLAVVLGYNYERTGRLTAPIVIHALFNAINVTQQIWWSK